MSDVGSAFLSALGRADPATPCGLVFPDIVDQFFWEGIGPEIGAGWYRNRFLYLWGEEVEALRRCVKAWSFLVPGDDRLILGRNAHGAILTLERASHRGGPPRVHVVDPVALDLWTDPNLDFGGLLGYWLPGQHLPCFQDERVYAAHVASHGHLGPDEILAPKVPLALGGTFTPENFQVEDIFAYYESTAPIYERALAKARAG